MVPGKRIKMGMNWKMGISMGKKPQRISIAGDTNPPMQWEAQQEKETQF